MKFCEWLFSKLLVNEQLRLFVDVADAFHIDAVEPARLNPFLWPSSPHRKFLSRLAPSEK